MPVKWLQAGSGKKVVCIIKSGISGETGGFVLPPCLTAVCFFTKFRKNGIAPGKPAARQGKERHAVFAPEKSKKGGFPVKRYVNASILYALIAMAGGVFYREFTKFNAFTGKTTFAVVHTHYFLLGMVFFLLLLLLEKAFAFSGEKTGRTLALYHTGLNITGAALLVRGVTQVLSLPLSGGYDAALSGIAGIGHLLLGISMVLLLLSVRRKV